MATARRLPLLALAGLVLVLALGGCAAIKPGSFALTQPAGIGPVSLRVTLCTMTSTSESTTCGPVKEADEGQMLLGLLVPVGTTVPAAIPTAPPPRPSVATKK